MLNLMKSFLLLFHLIILCHFSALASDHLIITADNVRDYIMDPNQPASLIIKGNFTTATTIEEDAFNQLPFKSSQYNFQFKDFKISTLPEKLFANNPWFSKKMISLDLRNLYLTTLHENIFHPLTETIGIQLIGNNLSSLPSNLFKNNLKLESVVIVSSKLNILPIGLFWNNPKLNHVQLGQNKLLKIRRGVFLESILKHLQLNLYDTYIMCLPSVVLKKVMTLSAEQENCLRESTERRNGCPPESERVSLCKDIDKEPSGIWDQWSNWTSCSPTCGEEGRITRTRICNHPQGTTDCQGDAIQVEKCSIKSCPRSKFGTWNQWSNWTSCSQTCGGRGEMTRTRTCNRTQDATECQGDEKDVKKCFIKSCSTKIADKLDLMSLSFTLSLVVVIQVVSVILMCFQ